MPITTHTKPLEPNGTEECILCIVHIQTRTTRTDGGVFVGGVIKAYRRLFTVV